MRNALSGLFLLILSGCALAPLQTGVTARSLAKGELELQGNFTAYSNLGSSAYTLVPSARLVYGLGSGWDLGVATELKTVTGFAKYSLIDSGKEDGFSLAALGAVVSSRSKISYFGGVLVSQLWRGFEPYGAYRFNVANFDRAYFDPAFFHSVPDTSFNFSSITLGLKYWLMATASVGTELVFLMSTPRVQFGTSALYNLQLSFVL